MNLQGTLGAIFRTLTRIPPEVWVVNEHTEEIVVVVSKYRPNRLLTGGGLNVSTSGVDMNLSTTVQSTSHTQYQPEFTAKLPTDFYEPGYNEISCSQSTEH